MARGSTKFEVTSERRPFFERVFAEQRAVVVPEGCGFVTAIDTERGRTVITLAQDEDFGTELPKALCEISDTRGIGQMPRFGAFSPQRLSDAKRVWIGEVEVDPELVRVELMD